VLLIDGLDEATHDGRNELADFLVEETRKLPAWMRIMVTSRPEIEVTAPFEGVTPFVLEAGSADNVADVLAFADHYLRPYAEAPGPLSEATRQMILGRSEGNWLYLEHLREALAAKHLRCCDLESFPDGLGAAYQQLFTRQFPDHAAYDRSFRPVIDLIVATREPLKIDLAADILGWSPIEKVDIPLGFGALLRIIDGTLRIYHRSVLEWLVDSRVRSRYRASAEQGHHEFARWGWAEYERGVAAMAGYARRQLAAHLAKIGAEDKLVRVLTDVRFLRGVAQAGSVSDLAQFWRDRNGARMCEAVRASFDELAQRGEPAVARYEAAIATGQLLRHIGHYEAAMYYFDQAMPLVAPGDAGALGRAHYNAGWCLRHMERFELAAARLHRAVSYFRDAGDAAGMARARSGKGMCLWHTFDDLEALECFEQAVPLFEKTSDRRGQAELHNHLGIVYRSLGKFEPALRHLRRAEAIYTQLADHDGLGKCLNSIGTAQWWSGHPDEAVASYVRADELNQRFNQPYVEGLTANNLGYLQLERGALDQALAAFQRAREIRQRIGAKGYEMLDLSGIALVWFRLGDVTAARALSKQAIGALDAFDTLEDLHRAYYNHHLIMKDGSAEDRAQGELALERARQLARRRFEPIRDADLRAAILAGVPLMKVLLPGASDREGMTAPG
jgi:tetratricopeptide (TPR) repeat protein